MKNTLFISLFILVSFPAFSQNEAVNPELAQLINQTIANYPKLREAALGTAVASERVAFQRAGYLPGVNANGTYNYVTPVAEASFGDPAAPLIIRFQPHNNYNLNLQANGLIFDFGKTKAGIDKAVADLDFSAANAEALKANLAFQVAQLYYGMLYTQKSIAVQEAQLRSLQSNADQLATKQRNGDALELDVLNASVALANAENCQIDLKSQLEKQQALMANLTGQEQVTIAAKGFDFQAVAAASDISANPDLLVAETKIKMAESEIDYYKKYLRPSLTYNGGLGFKNGYQPDINDFRFNWGLGAGISYPIYAGGKDQKLLRIARLNLESARAAAEGVARNASLEMQQAQADQRAAAAKSKTSAKIVEQARAALTIADARFKNGVATNVDVLTAQTNLEQAELTAISAQYQLCLAGLQLEKVMGLPNLYAPGK